MYVLPCGGAVLLFCLPFKECFCKHPVLFHSRYLFLLQVPVLITTEFVQGNIHRWGIAWSFDESERSKVVACLLLVY